MVDGDLRDLPTGGKVGHLVAQQSERVGFRRRVLTGQVPFDKQVSPRADLELDVLDSWRLGPGPLPGGIETKLDLTGNVRTLSSIQDGADHVGVGLKRRVAQACEKGLGARHFGDRRREVDVGDFPASTIDSIACE
jgi:hypothetical protein